MHSFLSTETCREIEQAVVAAVNAAALPFTSPRGVGDAVQEVLSRDFRAILGSRAAEYSETFARRAMADLAFVDIAGGHHTVDVKTHYEGGKFSMPNLVSVERLARFYEDDANSFDILLVRYRAAGTLVSAYDATFAPIEWLDWNSLTLGALGWGQIQIANARSLKVTQRSRAEWMCQLCDELLEFYPREVAKISQRIAYFAKVAEFWRGRLGDDVTTP